MEIENHSYNDITSLFLSKVHTKLVAVRKEQPNQFLITATITKDKLELANQRLKEFKNMQQTTGLFNDQDYKLNTLLNLIKEDIDLIQIHLKQLGTLLNNKLNQSIFDFLQSKTLDTSDQFKKILQSHTQRVKSQEERRTKLTGERDRLIKRGGFTQKYQKFNEEEENHNNNNHQSIQMFSDQKQNESKLKSIQKIESMLSDIASVFQRVGTMVKLQESMIERIDKYTEDASVNVSKGRKELQETYKKLSQNRGLIFKIFIILFIFSFIYITLVL